MRHPRRENPRKTPFGLLREASRIDYFSGTGGPGLTKCQSGARMSPPEPEIMAATQKPRQFPAIPRICRHRGRRGPWQNSPAPRPGGVLSKEFNFQLFIEKPREFIQFYTYFQESLFALNGFFIISGRAGDPPFVSSEEPPRFARVSQPGTPPRSRLGA